MFAVFIGGVEYILLFERGKNLAWIKFFTEKLRNVGRNSRLL